MQPEKESPLKTTELSPIGQRFAGLFFGGITGLVLSVILFLVLDVSGLVPGYDNRTFIRFVSCGAVIGALLGLAFPRPLVAIGSILGNLIPGF
jgi:hypothetical protein